MKVHPELRRFTAYVRTLFCHYHPISDGTESQNQQFLRLRYGNQYCWRTQDTFCPPCNVPPYNSTAVLKRLQHSPITKGRFWYRTTATRDRQKIIGKSTGTTMLPPARAFPLPRRALWKKPSVIGRTGLCCCTGLRLSCFIFPGTP